MQCLGILFQILIKFISETFPKRQFQSAVRKEQWVLNKEYLTFYQQNISKNAKLRNFVSSTDKIYQWEFPKVAVLKRSTKGTMSSSFPFVERPVLNLLLAKYEQEFPKVVVLKRSTKEALTGSFRRAHFT